MEANAWSFRATAHACEAPNSGGQFTDCDYSGSGQEDVNWDYSSDYGPGDEYYINTNYPIDVRQDFILDSDGIFGGYVLTLTQG